MALELIPLGPMNASFPRTFRIGAEIKAAATRWIDFMGAMKD
jgi:hypothetical protein